MIHLHENINIKDILYFNQYMFFLILGRLQTDIEIDLL